MTEFLANKLIAGVLMIAVGFALIKFDNSIKKESSSELDAIKLLYQKNPIKIGFIESMLALFSGRFPKSAGIFYAPFINWVVILIGTVFLLDALIVI